MTRPIPNRLRDEVCDLFDTNWSMTVRDVAREVGLSERTVKAILMEQK